MRLLLSRDLFIAQWGTARISNEEAPTMTPKMRSPKLSAMLNRLQGRMDQVQGRLEMLEGRLKILRGQARKARGDARVHIQRIQRQTAEHVERAPNFLRDARVQLRAVSKGVQAGVRAGVRSYRKSRP